jgi:hypothetical protein
LRMRRIASIMSAKGAEIGGVYPQVEKVAQTPVGSNRTRGTRWRPFVIAEGV